MKTIRLQTKILLGILTMIVFWGLVMSSYGFFVIKRFTVGEAQEKIKQNLKTVRSVYDEKFNQMRIAFKFINATDDLKEICRELGLDYLRVVDKENAAYAPSEIVRDVFKTGKEAQATRVIKEEELTTIRPIQAIEIRSTPRARVTAEKELKEVMAMEYARPLLNNSGKVEQVLYGGKIINYNFGLIDQIVDVVFEQKMYEAKPMATVTIFQKDVRVATNVLDKDRKRAIGTQISEEVYKRVFEQGGQWVDRAFVVTDWYITAYEPIRDIDDNIIGILYVGILEKPFLATHERLFAGLLMIILIGALPTILFSYFLGNSLIRPLTEMVHKITKVAHGELESRIDTPTEVQEIKELTDSFNYMSERLVERDKRLAVTNDKLGVMNKRYLDMIGFVSHELKGILSSIVLNTYLLQKRILGDINEKQENVLKSMARNLDYLAVTVKNFLNLSRIEKDELKIEKQDLLLKEHIFDPAIDSFRQQAEEKNMEISLKIKENLLIHADVGLMQIVVNNLLSNAVKYGLPNGKIRISAKEVDGMVEVEVYNDGEPIASVDVDKLFKKFSRIVYRGMETVKGTGIGLFITKEIIEKHGGKIWVEPALKGNAFKFRLAVH